MILGIVAVGICILIVVGTWLYLSRKTSKTTLKKQTATCVDSDTLANGTCTTPWGASYTAGGPRPTEPQCSTTDVKTGTTCTTPWGAIYTAGGSRPTEPQCTSTTDVKSGTTCTTPWGATYTAGGTRPAEPQCTSATDVKSGNSCTTPWGATYTVGTARPVEPHWEDLPYWLYNAPGSNIQGVTMGQCKERCSSTPSCVGVMKQPSFVNSTGADCRLLTALTGEQKTDGIWLLSKFVR